MPLIQVISIDKNTQLGIWEIAEPESYFLNKVELDKDISHPQRRKQHLAGRLLLKELEPSFPLDSILIQANRKPYLPDNSFHFSISHSKNKAVAIISREQQVGIDVEKISDKPSKIASRFLTSEELERAERHSSEQWLTLSWCAKETIYKWRDQEGLSLRENIHLHPFTPENRGLINASLKEGNYLKELQLYYLLDQGFALVWMMAN